MNLAVQHSFFSAPLSSWTFFRFALFENNVLNNIFAIGIWIERMCRHVGGMWVYAAFNKPSYIMQKIF